MIGFFVYDIVTNTNKNYQSAKFVPNDYVYTFSTIYESIDRCCLEYATPIRLQQSVADTI